MVETTKTQQDEVSTPEGKKGTTPEKEPETFTREQVEEAERKAKHDVDVELGRVTKLNADLIKTAQSIQARLAQRDKDEDEREREKYRDEPDKLSAIDERIKRRDTETKLAQKEQELEDEKAKTTEAEGKSAQSTKERNAREIATRLGVKAETLIKFTDGSTEAMEELAQSLTKGTDPLALDTGKTRGSDTEPESAKDKIRAGWSELHK